MVGMIFCNEIGFCNRTAANITEYTVLYGKRSIACAENIHSGNRLVFKRRFGIGIESTVGIYYDYLVSVRAGVNVSAPADIVLVVSVLDDYIHLLIELACKPGNALCALSYVSVVSEELVKGCILIIYLLIIAHPGEKGKAAVLISRISDVIDNEGCSAEVYVGLYDDLLVEIGINVVGLAGVSENSFAYL